MATQREILDTQAPDIIALTGTYVARWKPQVPGTVFMADPAGGRPSFQPLNLLRGAAPTSLADGDIWITTAGLFVRINGVTVGPLS